MAEPATDEIEYYVEFLQTHIMDIAIRADEEERRFYAWCRDYPEVPPVRARNVGIAVRNWLEDFETALRSGEVKP